MVVLGLGLMMAVLVCAYGHTVLAGDVPRAVGGTRLVPQASEQEQGSPVPPPAIGRMEIPEAGLSVEPPIGWRQLDEEPAWSPVGNGETRVGVSWLHLLSSMEPETILLPSDGRVLASVPIELEWGSGRQYLVRSHGSGATGRGTRTPPVSVELHVIVAVPGGETQLAYDLHAIAPSEEELIPVKAVLGTMIHTVSLTTPTRD